jgi:UDP-N-acetyl-D-mannosaminuronic acid dehydrogenase
MSLPEGPDVADLCVVGGGGRVGLGLSLVFARRGLRVVIQDVNAAVLDQIGRGEMPFAERGAEPLLREGLSSGRLTLSPEPAAVRGARAIIVVIGTPIDEFHNPDLKNFQRCFDGLLPFLSDDQLIVLRSTVFPGVTAWLE